MAYMRQTDEREAVSGPACIHLRSKGMYITGQTELDPEGDIGDGYCWCNQTQDQRGPDQNFVDRAKCRSGRACYQQVL